MTDHATAAFAGDVHKPASNLFRAARPELIGRNDTYIGLNCKI